MHIVQPYNLEKWKATISFEINKTISIYITENDKVELTHRPMKQFKEESATVCCGGGIYKR